MKRRTGCGSFVFGIWVVGDTYLDTDNLDGLIPSCQSTSSSARKDLVHSSEFLILSDAANFPQTLLGEPSKPESTPPLLKVSSGPGMQDERDKN
jgi:hypothetical protein